MRRITIAIVALILAAGVAGAFSNQGIQVLSRIYLEEQAAPSTPSSGQGVWYVSTSGEPRFINDAGTDTNLAGGTASPLSDTLVAGNTTEGNNISISSGDAVAFDTGGTITEPGNNLTMQSAGECSLKAGGGTYEWKVDNNAGELVPGGGSQTVGRPEQHVSGIYVNTVQEAATVRGGDSTNSDGESSTFRAGDYTGGGATDSDGGSLIVRAGNTNTSNGASTAGTLTLAAGNATAGASDSPIIFQTNNATRWTMEAAGNLWGEDDLFLYMGTSKDVRLRWDNTGTEFEVVANGDILLDAGVSGGDEILIDAASIKAVDANTNLSFGGTSSSSGNGGNHLFNPSDYVGGGSSGNGGSFTVEAGVTNATGATARGGNVSIAAGASLAASSDGGSVTINAGAATSGDAGDVNINGGSTSSNGPGGDVNLSAGTSAATDGEITLATNGSVRWRVESDGALSADDSIPLEFGTGNDWKWSYTGSSMLAEGAGGLTLNVTDSNSLILGTNNTGRWEIDSTGHLIPATTNRNIGSASEEIGDVYMGDDEILTFGDDQDGSIYHESSTGNLKISSGFGAGDVQVLGQLKGFRKEIIAHTTGSTLEPTTQGGGCVNTNRGASGTVTFTLNATPDTGDTYRFMRVAAQALRVDPQSGDALFYNGAQTAGKYIELQSDGAIIEVTWDGTNWLVTPINGTLAMEP